MRCSSCHRWLHALCSLPAALTPTEYPADTSWTCPCCGANNTVCIAHESLCSFVCWLQQVGGGSLLPTASAARSLDVAVTAQSWQ
jgi:hypothetical protein